MEEFLKYIPYIAPIITFAGGGLAGALYNAHRSKRQPVYYKRELIDVFKANPNYISLQMLLMEPHKTLGSGHGIRVNNLAVAKVTIINKGNQDLNEFKFGVTLADECQAIDVKMETLDRHHLMELESENPIGVTNPTNKLDFIVKPFNRGEEYTCNIVFIYENSPGEILVSSAGSQKLVEIGTAKEFAKEVGIAIIKETLSNPPFKL